MAIGTGNLPYTMSPVSPFDVITSQAENERIANIESLADGTGIGDKAITADKVDFTTFGRLFVRRTSTQSIPNSTTTNIIFNTVTEADGSAYNSTTGVYTAPSSGIYVLAARVTFQESIGISLRVTVNGTTYVSEDTPATGMYMTKSIGVSLRLSAGDTVAVAVHQGSGGARTIHSDGNTTNLSITRLA